MPRQAGYANPSANKSDNNYMGLDREAQRAQEPTCMCPPWVCSVPRSTTGKKKSQRAIGTEQSTTITMEWYQCTCRDPKCLERYKNQPRTNQVGRIQMWMLACHVGIQMTWEEQGDQTGEGGSNWQRRSTICRGATPRNDRWERGTNPGKNLSQQFKDMSICGGVSRWDWATDMGQSRDRTCDPGVMLKVDRAWSW
jgi:hypothetical protein